jgi:beta-glucanase (GH16 family)
MHMSKNNFVRMSGFYLIFLLVMSCSSSGSDDGAAMPEPQQQEQEEMVEESVDVNSPDYWSNAELVWSDEFDGDLLSSENWLFETGDHGWGNNELQNYVADDNVEVSDGILKVHAIKNDDGLGTVTYTSARLNSKKNFTFGRLEIRAKIPEHKGNGIWPALWMLGSNIGSVGWPACGEIDIMEYVSFEPNHTHFSIHSLANNHTNGTQVTSGPVPLETIEEEFHNYGILWTDQYIKFYIDDIDNIKLNFARPSGSSFESWPFSQPFYFLINIAVGGTWGGQQGVDSDIFPATMEIDYVRVYQVK